MPTYLVVTHTVVEASDPARAEVEVVRDLDGYMTSCEHQVMTVSEVTEDSTPSRATFIHPS